MTLLLAAACSTPPGCLLLDKNFNPSRPLDTPTHFPTSPHYAMENAYAQSTGQVLKHFSVQEHKGLDDAQVVASRAKYGSNGKPFSPSFLEWRDGSRPGIDGGA